MRPVLDDLTPYDLRINIQKRKKECEQDRTCKKSDRTKICKTSEHREEYKKRMYVDTTVDKIRVEGIVDKPDTQERKEQESDTGNKVSRKKKPCHRRKRDDTCPHDRHECGDHRCSSPKHRIGDSRKRKTDTHQYPLHYRSRERPRHHR